MFVCIQTVFFLANFKFCILLSGIDSMTTTEKVCFLNLVL